MTAPGRAAASTSSPRALRARSSASAAVVQTQELRIAGRLLEPLERHLPQHEHRVVGRLRQRRVVELPEDVTGSGIPDPPEIAGKLEQAAETFRKERQVSLIGHNHRCKTPMVPAGRASVKCDGAAPRRDRIHWRATTDAHRPMLRLLAFVLLVGVAPVSAQPATPAVAPPSSRELERLNWMEVRALVPARIDTVLLPLGTLEPHGVTANGADILAPVAIARVLAPKVNALVAPVVPYGVTGAMDAYPAPSRSPRTPTVPTSVPCCWAWRRTDSAQIVLHQRARRPADGDPHRARCRNRA